MARTIVIGGANADIKGRMNAPYLTGTSNPGEVTVSVGGVGRNIAENLARLDVEVSLLTVLGDDTNGRLVHQATVDAGVDLSLSITGPAATGTYMVILDENGELVTAVNDMRNIEWLDASHLKTIEPQLKAADFLVADCNIGAGCLQWLCAFAAHQSIRLLIEPVSIPKSRKLLSFERHLPVFAITPNWQQLEALTGTAGDEAIASLHALGFSNIVVHHGRDGALASDGRKTCSVPAFPVDDIADVTGAGDAAVAGFICGTLAGLSLADAARLGQAAASIKLGSRSSVAPFLNRDRTFRRAGFS